MSCKVAVLGAAGGIGQPLSLLLKQNQQISDLALFDVVPVVKGVAVDLSHIATPSRVEGYTKDDNGLDKALKGADLVVIPAGVPRKPGMTRDDLFKINAGIVRDLAQAIANNCPEAFICVISNPVNSTVPVVAEVLKQNNCFNPRKLFGVTTLDVLRAQTFSAEALGKPLESSKFSVPVVGGHSGATIVPLFSQAQPSLSSLDQKTIEALTNRVQFGGDEVVKAKDGAGSATLSMAAAGYRFAQALLDAKLAGKSGITEMSYVLINSDIPGGKEAQKEIGTGLDFFSLPVELDANGVKTIKPMGPISDYEKKLLEVALPDLEGNINKGVSFIQSKL